MSQEKVLSLLFGAASGAAIAAALIGLLLLGTAVAVDLQADAAAVLKQHPLFVAGSELISTSLLAAIPLFGVWYIWRKP